MAAKLTSAELARLAIASAQVNKLRSDRCLRIYYTLAELEAVKRCKMETILPLNLLVFLLDNNELLQKLCLSFI